MSTMFSKETRALHEGSRIKGLGIKPAAVPLFATSAFSMDTLSEVMEVYAQKGYTYIRTNNPNRDTLSDAISCLEESEATVVTSSCMAAISSTLLTLLKPGDHLLCSRDVYGETLEVVRDILPGFHIEADLVDFTDLDQVRAHIRSNTRVVYCEVASNPCVYLADIPTIADIAHAAGAKLVVDNTFTTPILFCPLKHGADVSINSLTKFLNGHSDAVGGAASTSAELANAIGKTVRLFGSPCDPYDAWTIRRGLYTAELRIPRQASTAAKLAKALEDDLRVQRVFHPSLESHPQYTLGKQMFQNGESITGMLSFIVDEDMSKIDDFMSRLHLAKYAITLGGIHTTLSYPCRSSHSQVPDAERRAMGITPGMLRVSVGIESPEDLIADFLQALDAFSR